MTSLADWKQDRDLRLKRQQTLGFRVALEIRRLEVLAVLARARSVEQSSVFRTQRRETD